MQKLKRFMFLFLTMAITAISTVAVFADPAVTMNTTEVISGGLTVLSAEIFSIIAVVVPVAFGITAAIIGVRFGIRFIRSLVGR